VQVPEVEVADLRAGGRGEAEDGASGYGEGVAASGWDCVGVGESAGGGGYEVVEGGV
jgi:hypothetical protein